MWFNHSDIKTIKYDGASLPAVVLVWHSVPHWNGRHARNKMKNGIEGLDIRLGMHCMTLSWFKINWGSEMFYEDKKGIHTGLLTGLHTGLFTGLHTGLCLPPTYTQGVSALPHCLTLFCPTILFLWSKFRGIEIAD